MMEMEQLQNEEERKPFVIDDDSKAEWAMRKIAELRMDTEKWQAHFDSQMDKIRKANEDSEAFFTACLMQYFEQVPKHETKTQAKYSLPGGDLVRKKQEPEYKRDDSKLLCFLQENDMGEYVKQKPTLDWASLKKACAVQPDGTVVDKETGLVLEGIFAQERPDKFEVKING